MPSSSAPVRRSLVNTVVHSWKGRFEVTIAGAVLVAPAEDVEQQLASGLRQDVHVAELVDDQDD